MSIGKRIREYRKALSLTQKELAEQSGIAEITIRQYENEKRTPNATKLKSIATALKISPALLMGMDFSSFDSQVDVNKIRQELKEDESIKNYFKILGFTLEENVSKWHLENETQIIDDVEYILSKGNHSVTISEKEFQNIQTRNRDTVEGIFYKKLILEENKNT
jgi:transcriptional regulator with XRE-family HTH domain